MHDAENQNRQQDIRTKAYPRVGLIGNPSDGYDEETILFTFSNVAADVIPAALIGTNCCVRQNRCYQKNKTVFIQKTGETPYG